MLKRSIVSGLAAVLVLGGSALAAAPKTDPDPPFLAKDASIEDIERWAERHVSDDEYGYLGSTDEFAYLIQFHTTRTLKSGAFRFWVKSEAFAPLASDEAEQGRSQLMLLETDCEGEKVRLLGQDSYSRNNLKGEQLGSEDFADADWMYPRPDTILEVVANGSCVFAAALAEQMAKEEAAVGKWRPVEKAGRSDR